MTISALSPLLTPTPTSTASTSTSTSSTKATTATDPVSAALQQAEKRIQAQVDATTASLSACAQLQSSVSDTQLASSALGQLAAGTSDADVQSAASKFVAAFNASIAAAGGLATPASGGSTTESRGAARVGRDLDMALTGNSATAQSLSAIGITRQADGSLAVDASKFAAAQKANPDQVRSTLAAIGQTVDQTTSAELATGGAVGDPLAALAQRSKALGAQQDALLDAVQKFEDNLSAQTTAGSASGAAGIAGLAGSSGGNTGFTGYGLAAYIANS